MEREKRQWQQNVDKKLDRILNELEFIKNRTATYLGRNEALTYLADETPIFINTDDWGCPMNFVNGGVYEEDYYRVFLSFRNPLLPMLDIGANLGVYSLRMASHMRGAKIHAFEPIPKIRNLFTRSIFLNGFTDRIETHPFAVSDKDGNADLDIPAEHAGGASIKTSSENASGISVELKCLDNFFPENFNCGLVKIDVEGHELHALRGMKRILQRSRDAVVMFEKLGTNSGIEKDVFELFVELEFSLFGIDGRRLTEIDLEGFRKAGGYFIASHPDNVNRDGLNRDFFHIFPSDFNVLEGVIEVNVFQADIKNKADNVIFHGPYWWLPRGYYRLHFDGNLSQAVTVEIYERFGYKVTEIQLEPGKLDHEFPIYRDLTKFELVMRPVSNSQLTVLMRKITLIRLA